MKQHITLLAEVDLTPDKIEALLGRLTDWIQDENLDATVAVSAVRLDSCNCRKLLERSDPCTEPIAG